MNFEFARQINPSLEAFNFDNALDIAESALKQIPSTEFHSVIGKSLLHHVDDLATWIESFYKEMSTKFDVKALYFELNEFDINTDAWYIYGFAFAEDGGYNLENMEWLCDVTREVLTKEEFILKGYEKLQNAFEKELLNENMENARDWCEQIIISRFMQLMRATHLKAMEKNLSWTRVPIYFALHDCDFIVRSELLQGELR